MKRYVFFYNGKRYSMTDDEIAAGHYFKERQNLFENAARQLLAFVFDDDPENVSEVEKAEKIDTFVRTYGVRPEEVNLSQIVSQYEKQADCNIPENTTWQSVIWDVLHFRKRN